MRRRELRVAAYLAQKDLKNTSPGVESSKKNETKAPKDKIIDEAIVLDELSKAARKLIKKPLHKIELEVATGHWDDHLDVLLVLEDERSQGPRSGLVKIIEERMEKI